MHVTINHRSIDYTGDPDRRLLDYLREDLGLTSPKRGCDTEAACGCCKVLINDKPSYGCAIKMGKVEGKTVTTLEGLPGEPRGILARSFVQEGGVQCGFCLPGIVLDAYALLESDPAPSRERILESLDRHLCRCTGYVKIADSIEAAARAWRGEFPPPAAPPEAVTATLPPALRAAAEEPSTRPRGGVGERLAKYTGAEAVLGERAFVGDLNPTGLRRAALKFSDHPRARIRGLDTREARRVLGVQAILTAEDIPGERLTGLIRTDWPVMVAVGETTRYIGDVLAVVVADTEAAARAAVERIHVDYAVEPPVTDVFAALEPDAPAIHPDGNCLSTSRVNRGDATGALADSAYVARGRYETPRIEHAFLELETCVAEPSDEGEAADGPVLRVYSQSQGVYEDRKALARLLALPETAIRVVQLQSGGGFGGKEDLTVQGHAALAAYRLGAPVKLALSRAESLRMHPKRHPFIMDYAVGCDAAGQLTAVQAELWADTGAYASVGMKVVERAVGHTTGAYHVPHVDVAGWCVYTNNIPAGAMRGFGVNQVTFALEACLDELCRQGGFDRWQFRYDNALDAGSLTATGQRLGPDTGLRETLRAVKPDYDRAAYAGLACAIKNTGVGNGMADIGRARLHVVGPEHLRIAHGWTEMGQGVHNMAVQVFCEATGLPPEWVEVTVDTEEQALCGMTTSSRGTALVGNAVLAACQAFNAERETEGLSALVGRAYTGTWTCDWTAKPGTVNAQGDHFTHFSYGFATQLVELDAEGRLARVVSANDAGRIMNPTLFEGQIEGAVHMGLGYAISEELPLEAGELPHTRLRRLGLIPASQMPEVVVRGVEVPAEHGPYGAKGVGEIGLVPTAAAVANARTAWDGIRRNRLPLREPDILPPPARSTRGRRGNASSSPGAPAADAE
jgi:xanthine dehydrogenase molybdenum-binding subunit